MSGKQIPFTPIAILNEAQRSEEPPCTNTGISTRRFFAVLRHRWSFRRHAVGMTIIIYLLFASYSFLSAEVSVKADAQQSKTDPLENLLDADFKEDTARAQLAKGSW